MSGKVVNVVDDGGDNGADYLPAAVADHTLFIFYKHAVYKHSRLQIAHMLSTL